MSGNTAIRPFGGFAVAVVAVLACAVAASPARADGDPASDFLVVQNVFVPYDANIPTQLAQQLRGLTADAKSKGYPLRVALIAKPYDLGAITALWRKPQKYAKFLAQELAFVYRGRLLIVMPNGFGYYHVGHPTTEARALANLTVAPGSDGLTRSAIAAVQRLAAVDGITLNPANVTSPAARNNHDRLVIILAVAAALVLLAAARMLVPRLRRGGRALG